MEAIKRIFIVQLIACAICLLVMAVLTGRAKADGWAIDAMNEQIEKTNVIVGGVCSGTIINKDERLMLTAYHCVDNLFTDEEVKEADEKTGEVKTRTVRKKKPLEIITRKVVDFEIVATSSHLAKIVGSNRASDIALLQVIDADYKPDMAAKLAPDSFKYSRGVKVYAVGNPGIEYDNSITEGIISAPQRTVHFSELGDDGIKMFQHSASTIGGNSGGSILNDKGELIGTVTGGIRGAAISFGVPISFTKEMIRKAGFAKMLEAQ